MSVPLLYNVCAHNWLSALLFKYLSTYKLKTSSYVQGNYIALYFFYTNGGSN